MKLNVKIGKVQFKNPVTVASGTFGYIEKYCSPSKISQLGAIVPKTVTLNLREGNPSPRIVETPSGMINAIGIENQGIDNFLSEKLPKLTKFKIPVILSISANTDKEFVTLAKKVNNAKGICAIELNLSCPNLKKKQLVAQDAKATYRLVKAVKKVCKKPVIAKLTPNVTNIVEIAQAAKKAGADAVSLVNTFAAMAIDIKNRKPVLGNIVGGLSGPAIKPIALKMVYDIYRETKMPIIAMGGIMTNDDALEFLIAGASMVAVGTASFVNPNASIEILSGIKKYMKKNKIKDIKQLIGSIRT
ncbi:MAG: dihydroorotate dehydrogenase [Candidatus Aceula meridiana]|nr:dihydroorotate dehydrogenase [Candidatus Aceula meridiana]